MVLSTTHLRIVLCSQFSQASFDNWVNFLRTVSGLPHPNIKTLWPVEWDWVTMEDIRHYYEVTIGSKLVCNELCVDETVTNHVSDAIWLR